MSRLQELNSSLNYLSIIIPCYNEANRTNLTPRLKHLLRFVQNIKQPYEVIFSLDGCSDNTESIISEFINSRKLISWSIVSNKINRGKGYAIRQGIQAANGTYILFMDADLSVQLQYIYRFINQIEPNVCLIGSRYLKESEIRSKRPLKRAIISRLTRIVTRPLIKTKLTDTQCGFKLFPKAAIESHLQTMRCDKWLFDVELLMVLESKKIIIKELPIIWENDNCSTLDDTAIDDAIDELRLLYKKKRSRKGKFRC